MRSVRHARGQHRLALLPRRPVLGQRPARLAHEPDRRMGHRLAAAGPQEGDSLGRGRHADDRLTAPGTRRSRSTVRGGQHATIVSSRAPRGCSRSPCQWQPGGEGGHGNEPDVASVRRVWRRAAVRPAPRDTGQLPGFAGRRVPRVVLHRMRQRAARGLRSLPRAEPKFDISDAPNVCGVTESGDVVPSDHEAGGRGYGTRRRRRLRSGPRWHRCGRGQEAGVCRPPGAGL